MHDPMSSHRRFAVRALVLLSAAALLAALAPAARAGFGDGLRKGLDKAKQAAGSVVDKTKGQTPPAPASPSGDDASEKPAAAADNGSLNAVSTKFDYVPGDSVLFMDDFTQDDLGEFPARWKLYEGTFEVAEMAGEHWVRCTSNTGRIRMKVPARLPEFWTLEFDYYCKDPGGAIVMDVTGMTATNGDSWQIRFPFSGDKLRFTTGEIASEVLLEGSPSGRHHIMFMTRGQAMKVYVDRQRMASVPELANGPATEIDFRLGAASPPMLTNVRFAEGCRPPRDMLATGKLVTYGIRFATGSDVVLPESAPVLRQVAAYLQANPGVKLRITGHTDNVGTPASNLDLSRRRAASVAKVLGSDLGVAADRLATDGKGDTQSLASNAKPEGRAMNRRVEFAKM